MHENLEAVQHKFIENIGKLCDSFGLNKFVAQLYAVLYLSDKPLSMDDMAAKLKVSKSNVCINIRELENWGAVRSVWVKGSRKDHYEANLDIKGVLINKVRSGLKKRLSDTSDMLDTFNGIMQNGASEWSEDDKKLAMIFEDRFRRITELKEFAVSALSIADKII